MCLSRCRDAEYDTVITGLNDYLVFMGEPARVVCHNLDFIVLGFPAIFFLLIHVADSSSKCNR